MAARRGRDRYERVYGDEGVGNGIDVHNGRSVARA